MICIRLAVGEQVSNYVARQTRHRRIRPDQLLLLSLPMAITVCDATAHRFRAAFNAIASADRDAVGISFSHVTLISPAHNNA